MTMLYETFDLLDAFYKRFLAPTVHSLLPLNLLPDLRMATQQLGLRDEDVQELLASLRSNGAQLWGLASAAASRVAGAAVDVFEELVPRQKGRLPRRPEEWDGMLLALAPMIYV